VEHVRVAGAGDLARCAELLAQGLAEIRDRRGGELLTTDADAAALVAEWSGGEDRQLLVGLFGGETVGLAAGDVRRVPAVTGRVQCCYVEPPARGVGVGSALLESLLGWFDRRGCAGVDAAALPGDRSTKQLYESAGFKARLLVLHRRSG
jgi:GNAT superfamily N-acetyltransferase